MKYVNTYSAPSSNPPSPKPPKKKKKRQPVDSYCEKVVVGAGDSLGIRWKGSVRRWKPLPGNAKKTVTENTRIFVKVIFKV
jgi:hypothetical protein